MLITTAALLATATSPRTLAGISLGSSTTQIAAVHPEAHRESNGAGSKWTWKRTGGGVVTVYANGRGYVTKVEFLADEGESDSIDLPCANPFDVQGSHVNLQMASDPSFCTLVGSGVGLYTLKDGSTFQALFDGGDGQLHEAVWYRP
jgi:hypothetical protein